MLLWSSSGGTTADLFGVSAWVASASDALACPTGHAALDRSAEIAVADSDRDG